MSPPSPPRLPLAALDPAAAPPPAAIDWPRYRKLRRFVTRTFVEAFLHDVVLNRPLLAWARRPPLGRWQQVARRYRALAVEMGGVLIKLGQFLSIRVDVLPPEITRELAGLQDEVPPAPYEAIVAEVEADLGCPLGELFADFAVRPLGSASLAQVHAARLAVAGTPPGAADAGGEVVVKVLRPGIDTVVETDLAAIRLAVRLLRPWKRIRRRVDLERMAAEVTATTRAELDMAAEGRNAERFAELFADEPGVRAPRVFWRTSGRRTLTLENVAFVKIADHAALDRAGVSRGELAKALYRTFMRQVFVHDFVHADPHPGNLFVRPLPVPVEGEGDGAPAGFRPAEGAPFQLVFVDFGMVAAIPPRLRGSLREALLGLATRDAERIVHAAQSAGLLLPGADLKRLIDVHEDLFQRFWGVRLGEVRDVAMSEARYFFREYRDLLFELPFQVQVDLLYVSRAVGLVAGLTTSLDPRFDPWAETLPFAERLGREEMAPTATAFLRLLRDQAAIAVRLPEKVDRVLSRTERGTLELPVALSPEARRPFERLDRAVRRLGWSVVAGALAVAGAMLRAADPPDPLAPWLWGAAGVFLLWGIVRGR